jgi:DNA-binding NarL/FixJ family response regulator
MIVEDNIPFRGLIRSNLISEFPGMEVVEAGNREEALKGLASSPIDLIFMDIRLPGQNGLELTKQIKADYQGMPIAILTSYQLDEYREAAVRCGADCYIVKGSMIWDQISIFVTCFQRARETGRLRPGCFLLSSVNK